MKYDKRDVINSLNKIGLKKNDIIFTQSNIALFGVFKPSANPCSFFFKTILKKIGPGGTLIVPTFTYSLNGEIFDKQNSPSKCGIFSEYVRKTGKGKRSFDPVFSIYSIGKHAKYFCGGNKVNLNAFGKTSFFSKFFKKKGKIINFNDGYASAHLHFFEKELKVYYRKDKKFKVFFTTKKKIITSKIYKFYCRKSKNKYFLKLKKFNKYVEKHQIGKKVKLGLGNITYLNIVDMKKIIFDNYKKNKKFLI